VLKLAGAVQKELMEAVVVAAVSLLTGKFTPSPSLSAGEGSLIFYQSAKAIGDLTDMSAHALPRDSQRRSLSGNAIDNIKRMDNLNNFRKQSSPT
jgi:hypothetical protein